MSGVLKLQELCTLISKHPGDSLGALKELTRLVKEATSHFIGHFRAPLIATLYQFIQNPGSFTTEIKSEVIDILTEIFKRLKTDNVVFYFNISGFLIGEVYDMQQESLVRDTYEEYKLSVINCIMALNKSLSIDIILNIYDKEHIPKHSPILHVCIGLAKAEKLRILRIAAMECIMTLARIDSDLDASDVVLWSQIADAFMFFVPGLLSGLSKICAEDEKAGHKVTKTAVRTWGRLVNLVMKNYEPTDDRINFNHIKELLSKASPQITMKNEKKWRNNVEIQEYIKSSSRTTDWFKNTDLKIFEMVHILQNLCSHSHCGVRLELADISLLLLENCARTMPKSLSKIVVILITLSEDDDEKVSGKCKLGIEDLSHKLPTKYFKQLLEYLEEDFYNLLNSIPRTFNGLDNQKQLISLNLLIGYICLFGKYELVTVLHSTTHLRKLIESLLYICELERTTTQLLDEWTVQDFDTNPDLRTPWKRFVHFTSNDLVLKLSRLCELLAQDVIVDIVVDCLLETYNNDEEKRKEATVLLNEILSAKTGNTETIKVVVDMYLEPSYWNIPISTSASDENIGVTLGKVQNNIVQLCLQLEGIGKMALLMQEGFRDFLLKTMYPVIEKAGSGQPLLKAAGLAAITNISIACKYRSVTDLINNNSDYFSYHVTRKLRRLDKNQHVLNVLGVIMNHCSMDVLPSLAHIVEDVLYQSRDCTSKNSDAFMRVFNIFTKCLLRWLDVKIQLEPIKSKAEKELDNFEVSNMEEECNDFSDAVLGKTPDEMYEEDMKKSKEELEEETYPDVEHKKPEPPQHIKLTVAILKRTLHFLPSKDKASKIHSLEILRNGLEVIRDWEDELLPIVHQIWSPLVNRFKDNEPLIFNLSFQLLITLARLSKEFIRSRTVKDVLPSILDVVQKLSKESYLKDRGSAFRYTQAYKLQTVLLEQLARLIIDLEMSEEHIQACMQAVKVYLSDKQPLPLRNHCLEFYKTLIVYDANLVRSFVNTLERLPEYDKNIQCLFDSLNKN